MTATSLKTRPDTVSSRELSIDISRRSRVLSRRRTEMSGAEFVLLATGWVAAVAGVLTISLLVRSFA